MAPLDGTSARLSRELDRAGIPDRNLATDAAFPPHSVHESTPRQLTARHSHSLLLAKWLPSGVVKANFGRESAGSPAAPAFELAT